MLRSELFQRLLFPSVLVLALASGCRATIPDGWFGCTTDDDCPPGQSCGSDQLCRAPAVDAGVDDGGWADGGAIDGGAIDGSVVDGGAVDGGEADGGAPQCDDGLFCNGEETFDRAAGSCIPGVPPCGTDPCDEETRTCGQAWIEVRFVHAAPGAGQANFAMPEVDALVSLTYGHASGPVTVPVRSGAPYQAEVQVGSTMLPISMIDPEGAKSVLVVLVQAPGGSALDILTFEHRFPSSGGTRDLAIANAIGGEPVGVSVRRSSSSAGPLASIPFGGTHTVAVASGEWSSLRGLDLQAVGDGEATFTTAGFSFPAEPIQWIVLLGELGRLPSHPSGPQLLMIEDEGSSVVSPDPLVGMMNVASTAVHVCVSFGASAPIAPMELELAPGKLLPTFAVPSGAMLSIATSRTGLVSCSAGSPFEVAPRLRYLFVVTDSGGGVEPVQVEEPGWMVGAPHSSQTHVAFVNALQSASADLYVGTSSSENVSALAAKSSDWVWVLNSSFTSPLGYYVRVHEGDAVLTSLPGDLSDRGDALFLVLSRPSDLLLLRRVRAPYGQPWELRP